MLSVSQLRSRSLSIRCVYFIFNSTLLLTSSPYKVLENRNRITQDVDDILKALSGIEALYENSALNPSFDIAILDYGVFKAVQSLYECVISTSSAYLVYTHSFFYSQLREVMLQHENVVSKYDLVLKGHTAVVERRSRNPIQAWKRYVSKKHMKEAHTRLMEWYNRDDITSMINELRRSTDNAHRNFLASSQCFISSYLR